MKSGLGGGPCASAVSAASSQVSTPSRSPSVSLVQAYPVASMGRWRSASSGSAWSQSRSVRSSRCLLSWGRPSSTRSAARAVSPPARAWCRASPSMAASVYQPAAARCRCSTRVVPWDVESCAQRVGEEVVIAVPAPLVVQGDQEQVRAFEGLQHALPVGPAGQRLAQATGELVEHAGVEQEFPDLVRLALQDLLDEIVQDEPVAPGERLDEIGDVVGRPGRMTSHREGSQLESGGPALGARLEGCHQRGVQTQPHRVVQECLCLLCGEAQVACTKLQELPADTQS